MIKLWQFAPALGLPNPSPFCMKVETWLKLSGLAYETKSVFAPGKGPLGKLPFVEDEGHRIPDSSLIIAHLSEHHGVDLDSELTTAQRAVAHGIRRMVEEHLYWAILYSRWIDPANWQTIKTIFFGKFPPGLRDLIGRVARGKMLRDARGHGLCLHQQDEIYRRGADDIDALADVLGAQDFIMGANPTSLDATVYAFLANIWQTPLETPLKAAVGRHENLVTYCARMKQRCFPG